MNERIKELAGQAKKYALDAMIKITDKEQALKVYSETYDTKFAELIVLECAVQSMSIGRYNTPSGITPDLAIAIAVGLKKHFGVEE